MSISNMRDILLSQPPQIPQKLDYLYSEGFLKMAPSDVSDVGSVYKFFLSEQHAMEQRYVLNLYNQTYPRNEIWPRLDFLQNLFKNKEYYIRKS